MSHSAAVIGRSGSTAYLSGTDRYRPRSNTVPNQ